MSIVEKDRVFRNGRSQAVRIPAAYRFKSEEVYIQRDPRSGVIRLSERPLRSSMEEIFAKFDEAGAADFMVERDDQAFRRLGPQLKVVDWVTDLN